MSYNFSDLKNKLKKTEEWLAKEYSQIHTGRVSPAVLDSIFISVYGSNQPIKNMASINIEDPKTIRVAPWDKNQIKEIESAIRSSGLSLSVSVDADGLRVSFPQLTAETRASIVKICKGKMEEARISVRKEREEVWNDIQKKEKEGEISEDVKFKGKDELQKIIDEINNKLEQIFNKKETEISN